MRVRVIVEPNTRYRVFAHVGNLSHEQGVTVTIQMVDDADEIMFEFGSRQDAVTFFRHAAMAAEVTTASADDEMRSGAALMVEATTTESEHE